jgi:hypothetical protein
MAVLQKKKNSLKSKLRTVAKSSSNSKKKFNKTRKTGSKTRKMRGGFPKMFYTLPRSPKSPKSPKSPMTNTYTVKLPPGIHGIRTVPAIPISKTEADVQKQLLHEYMVFMNDQDKDVADAYTNKMFEIMRDKGKKHITPEDVHREATIAKTNFAVDKLKAIKNSLRTYGYQFSEN